MHKRISTPIVIVAVFLFVWVNFPRKVVEALRTFAVSSFYFPSKALEKDAVDLLRIENQRLKAQLHGAYEWLLFDRHIEDLCDELADMKAKTFASLRKRQLLERLEKELLSLPAQVIFRDPSSWSSTLWVNVGEKDNLASGSQIIAKNSPVVAEGALVGVIEEVKHTQSRVRLITDSGLKPAVRVARGSSQNRKLARHIESFYNQIEQREDLFDSKFQKEHLISSLNQLCKKLGVTWEDGYLAKGEVRGSSHGAWRARSPILKGVGFNYEYPDEEGPARALNSEVPIIQPGDLLVTSGLDGVFPTGIHVGTVIRTLPLKQNSHFFEIEVRPSASNFSDLKTVFILPPAE